MVAQAVVHTTGINWQATLAIVGTIVTVMTVIIGAFAKFIGDKMTNAINKFRIDVVSALDLRLTSVEAKLEDVRTKQNQFKETK
jgi:hypothetical protein